MVTAVTQNFDLTTSWTLIADGDLGATEVLIQKRNANNCVVAVGTTPPSPTSVAGVQISDTLSLRIDVGEKLYARAVGANTTISVIIGEVDALSSVVPATSAYGSGTREHVTATLIRQAVGAASARIALPALGPSREVYVMANTRCFFRTGDSAVIAAAGTSHPLGIDERFYFRVPAGHTHIAFVQDAAAGNITICAVV